MGLFSKIFGGRSGKGKVVSGKNPGKSWVYANKFNRARGGFAGGYGAWTFGNIMNAHCTPYDIVETFELNKEENSYGCDAYLEAYVEMYDEATAVYEEIVGYYMSLIEIAEAEISDLESDIKECENEIDDLQEEIEDLQDELEFADDPNEMEEIQEDISECREEIEELHQMIEEMEETIAWLNEDIGYYHDEIESTSIEELIDLDEVEKRAMDYACLFAQEWIDGNTWIPTEVLNWAYYDVSDHNN